MATTIRLSNGAEIELQADLDELITALESALVKNGLAELRGADGRVVVLNPRHVLYMSNGSPDPVVHRAEGAVDAVGA